MNYKVKQIPTILAIIYFLIATATALSAQVHTDEYWSYATIYYASKGYLPFKDYFSHRLPFFSLFYAHTLDIFEISLHSARMVSVFLATLVLYKLLILASKSGSNIYVYSVLLLAYIHPTNLYLMSTATTYALTNAMILLSLRSYDNNKIYEYVLINKMIFLTRYIVDVFPVIEAVNLYLFNRNRKYFIASILSTLLVIVGLILVFGEFAYLDTFVYNKQSFEFMLSSGAISNNYTKIEKFVFLRKEEIKYWFAIYSILFMTIYYCKRVEGSLKAISHYLVYLILIYLFYYFSLNDFPITKISAIPIILYAYTRMSKSFSNVAHKILICLTLIPVLIFKIPFTELERKNSLAICKYIDCSERTLSINPILQTLTSTIDTKLIMELYSFAQNDVKYGLFKAEDIIKSITNMEYKNIILDERFISRKNMSKMISDIEFTEIFAQLNKNYDLKEIYFDTALGMNVHAYTLK
jgi:hypothetical protein